MKLPNDRNEAITEIGAILTSGYLRLLAKMCEQENLPDKRPNLSAPSSLYPLDNTGPRSDVSMANNNTNLFQEKGLE